ncbi:MAG: ABC transporter permease [Bacteroidales bacterium]|nr:ABC transporter permease [Bacteroidales bacterium]MCM1423094.1 ABC transporter permease [bacterium]
MRKFTDYFFAQLKRVCRLLPLQMGTSLVICACVGMLAFLLVAQRAEEGQERYRIGLVGDVSGSYLGFGIAALQTVDDSRLMIELVELSETEAEDALSRGELTAVVRVPDDFLDSVVYGRNDTHVTYLAPPDQTQLGYAVMGEVADVASTLVTASQSAIYAMQRILYEQEGSERIGEETDRLNLMLINLVLSRSGFEEVEVLGYAEGLSLEAYYFCRLLLLVLLLAGLSGSIFFLYRKAALSAMLKAGGVGALSQIAGEYLAYLGLLCAGFILPSCVLVFALAHRMLSLPEWKGAGAEPFFVLLPAFFAAAAMFAALQLFLYELADGIVNGLMLQLLCGVGMAYFSGYFYPAAFLPEQMGTVGSLFPTGAAARLVEDTFLGKSVSASGAAVLLWLMAFLLLAAFVRRCRIRRT